MSFIMRNVKTISQVTMRFCWVFDHWVSARSLNFRLTSTQSITIVWLSMTDELEIRPSGAAPLSRGTSKNHHRHYTSFKYSAE